MKQNTVIKILTVFFVAVFGTIQVNAETYQTIISNGNPANRVDIAVLGDGYTAAEMTKFANDAQTLMQSVFAEEPYKEYQRYYNVHRVDVVSNQSGADHSDRIPPVFVDTALDAAYNCFEIQRLICVDVTKVNQVIARTLPASYYDVILVLVNDPEYGGSGGPVAVASTAAAAVELILHEVGHSFALLADEYSGSAACRAGEPPYVNATRATTLATIKWNYWINAGTPIPTTTTTAATPGLYLIGCGSNEAYAPTYQSKMRLLDRPFEQINTEQHVKRIYNFVSPLDASLPTADTVTLTTTQNFSVTPLLPLTHNLNVSWLVDGQAQASGTTFTLDGATLTPGNHTVTVNIADPTAFVRNDPAQVLRATRTWNIIYNPIPTALTVTRADDRNNPTCAAGDCSLREALNQADGDAAYSVINFNIPANSAGCAGTNCTIILSSPLAPAADGGRLTTIDGNSGANVITLSGNGAIQILNVGSGVNLAADNLNFTRGSNSNGGAVFNSGTLSLTNSALYGNSASSGGAIYNDGGSQLSLTNVTISGNSAASLGGGIFNGGTVTTATNCTITNNTAQFEGGVVLGNASSPFTLRNTIIAGNTASFSPDANGNFTSQGYNLIGNASGANGFTATGDQTGVDARLAPLGNYGGKTLTHALLDGGALPSPAINTGTTTGAPTTDQRGAARVGITDKGAFEVNNTSNGGTFVAILSGGSLNSPYQSQIISNNNGFTYSVTGGALPNGVSLTTAFSPAAIVMLSGTPTQSGTFNFTITATNGGNSIVTNYALQIAGPTAAGVSVSGAVVVDGRGFPNAIVTLTDQNGAARTVRSNTFGYFAFADVEVGRVYIIQVTSKRYQFQPQIISVNEEISSLLITPE